MKNNSNTHPNFSSKPDFIDMVNHELKSPLVTIKISAEILQKQNRPLNKEYIAESLKAIDAKVDYLTQLINNYTDLIKIKSHHLIFKKEVNTLKNLVSMLKKAHPELVIDQIPNTNEKLIIDSSRFVQTSSGLINVLPKLSTADSRVSLHIVNQDKIFLFYLYSLKNDQIMDKRSLLSFSNKSQLLNDGWQKKDNERINTIFAEEFFRLYHGDFSIFYNQNIGVILYFNLPKLA